MKFITYISSLLPSFSRDRIVEDLRLTESEIKEFTLPAYESGVQVFKNWDFKSPVLEQQFATFNRMVKATGNPVVVIHNSFKTVLENLKEIEILVNHNYTGDVAGMGLTYLKANLLQFVECMAFFSKYSRKFLVYIYVHETNELQVDNGIDAVASLTPAELEWIQANLVSFCTVLSIITKNTSDIKKLVSAIPDVVITSENASTLGETMGENKIDPFSMKLIPIWLNPIYHVGMFVAEWQASRYKAAQEELKLLQLRKINLEKLSEGKPDAHIQQQIIYMESRCQSLNYKIAKMEKENA